MEALPLHLLAEILDREPVARLALLGDDGAPEVMPIVFARVDEALYSPIDGKPKSSARLARLRYIAREPRVGLVIDRYADDWRQLWWLRLAAVAREVGADHPDFEAAVVALRGKYPQYQSTPLFSGEPTMIRFEILDSRWWSAAGLDGLRDATAFSAPPRE